MTAGVEQQRAEAGHKFSSEFLHCWQQLPDKRIFFLLLAAWVFLFQFLGHCSFNFADTPSLFAWMWGAWSAPALDSSHGKVIPLVVLVLLWLKRQELMNSIGKTWWPALLLLAAALSLHLAGFVVQQPRVSVIALFLGLYSFVGLVWGWPAMKKSFFPFVIFAFCMPLGTFVEKFTLPLRMVSTTLSAGIARSVLGIPVIQQGTQLFDPNGAYNFEVAAACSGIRSFIALLAVTTIFSMIAFRTFWRRVLMIALTAPLVIVCNVLRLTTIILAAQGFGQRAGNFVHEWFGFVTYGAALVVVLLAGRWLKEKEPDSAP